MYFCLKCLKICELVLTLLFLANQQWLQSAKIAYNPSRQMYIQYNDGPYYRPILEVQNSRLWPYMVTWILTGNGRILSEILLNLWISFDSSMFLANQQWFQYAKIAYNSLKQMCVQYNDGPYYRPIFEVQNSKLWPYMVTWILTGNGRILSEILLNLSFEGIFELKKYEQFWRQLQTFCIQCL